MRRMLRLRRRVFFDLRQNERFVPEADLHPGRLLQVRPRRPRHAEDLIRIRYAATALRLGIL